MFQSGLVKNIDIFDKRMAKLVDTFLQYYNHRNNSDNLIVEYLYYDKAKIGFKNNNSAKVIISETS